MLNTLQSPRYFSILAGFDVNGDGFPFSDRTGTVGRNSYRGASYYDTDVRLQRIFISPSGSRRKPASKLSTSSTISTCRTSTRSTGRRTSSAQCPGNMATTSEAPPILISRLLTMPARRGNCRRHCVSTSRERKFMAHIAIEEGIPGILGPMKFRPETTKPLRQLAEVLLRGDNSLTRSERETIAAFVSSRNDCRFCQLSHSAAAAEHLGGNQVHYSLIDSVKADFLSAGISPKLKALLAIAAKVQQGGKHVTPQDIAAARAQEATDREIHDTVLIAAAFCMFNRYVDGLATWQPEDPTDYREMGKLMAHSGYTRTEWETTNSVGESPEAQPGSATEVSPT